MDGMQDNTEQAKKELDSKMKQLVEIIGGLAEGYAKDLCPVDTGLLRNSITHVDGEGKLKIRKYTDDAGKNSGQYPNGSFPQGAESSKYTAIIGTNVQYAPYQELGAPNIGLKPQPFLRPAIENHKQEYKSLIEDMLKQ